MLEVPVDLAACDALPEWRASYRWPIDPLQLAKAFPAALGNLVAAQRGLHGVERHAFDLTTSQVLTVCIAALEAAYSLQQAGASTRLVGTTPEWKFLQGESDAPPPSRALSGHARNAVPRLPLRRHAEVSSWWTPWWRVPGAMARPEVVAIGENHLLVEAARRSPRRIAYKHPGFYLREARRRATGPGRIDLGGLAALLRDCVLKVLPIDEPWRGQLVRLLNSTIAPMLHLAATDSVGLTAVRKLPTAVWGANGGYYVSRAVGHEIGARGGSVVRFDHGGTLGMIIRREDAAMAELLTCSEFVMNSEALASNLRTSGASELLPAGAVPRIVGGAGDRSILEMPVRRVRPRGSRPRVVYCSTIYTGFARHTYSVQPDPMVLDWTLRVAECLAALPIDLLCKPHPEGVLRGKRHPLADVAPVSSQRFEAEMADADIYVFDRYHSTTFWLALCTDRPVIYLDAVPCTFHPSVEPLLRKRCTVISVSWDERNRPILDGKSLASAVLDAPAEADPSAFQALLAGTTVH